VEQELSNAVVPSGLFLENVPKLLLMIAVYLLPQFSLLMALSSQAAARRFLTASVNLSASLVTLSLLVVDLLSALMKAGALKAHAQKTTVAYPRLSLLMALAPVFAAPPKLVRNVPSLVRQGISCRVMDLCSALELLLAGLLIQYAVLTRALILQVNSLTNIISLWTHSRVKTLQLMLLANSPA